MTMRSSLAVATLLAVAATTNAQPQLVEFDSADSTRQTIRAQAQRSAVLASILEDPLADGVRVGRIGDTDAVFAQRSFRMALARDAAEFHAAEVQTNANGTQSLRAVNVEDDSEAALVIDGDDVLGSIRVGGTTWNLRPLGGGRTAVYRFDSAKLQRHPPGWSGQPVEVEGEGAKALSVLPEVGTFPPLAPDTPAGNEEANRIDLLIAYTPEAAASAGNIGAYIQLAVDNTKRVHRTSGTGVTLRHVHSMQTAWREPSGYTQTPSMMNLAMLLLTLKRGETAAGVSDTTGALDDVLEARDRHLADIVTLITRRIGVAGGGICGVGWLLDAGDSGYSVGEDRYGMNIIGTDCETASYFTLAHEIGHNQGGDHNPGYTTLPAASARLYRHGLCNARSGWHTVMSYQDSGPPNGQQPCRRGIPYLSSPDLQYGTNPTGNRARHDNRRVVMETLQRVAAFRTTQDTPPPTGTATYAEVLPYIPGPDMRSQGFFSIHRGGAWSATVSPPYVAINLIDPQGRIVREVEVDLPAEDATVRFSADDLFAGNSAKGIRSTAVTSSREATWGQASVPLGVTMTAHVRNRTNGFVAEMGRAAEMYWWEDSGHSTFVDFLNPGSNREQVGWLHVLNPDATARRIVLAPTDDAGVVDRNDFRLCTLGPHEHMRLSTQTLEGGGTVDPRCSIAPPWRDGQGKWRVLVFDDPNAGTTHRWPIVAMSFIAARTAAQLGNVSDTAGLPIGAWYSLNRDRLGAQRMQDRSDEPEAGIPGMREMATQMGRTGRAAQVRRLVNEAHEQLQ